jgi:tetratricopeptide (TPR) repeat protein
LFCFATTNLCDSQAPFYFKLSDSCEFILIAETEYKNEKPEASKNNFQQALTVKPNELYPKDFIRKIDDEKYNKLVKSAEDEYKSEKFEISKSYFEQAMAVKPSEKYPKDFIRKIDIENANIRSSADSLFRLKDFDNALIAFKQSLKYNSNNNKSKEKIRDIENTKNEISETNIKINKKKIELEPELGRVLKKVYLSTNAYFENKLYAEKDIFIALSIKKKFFEVLKKIQALEETKDKEIQKQLKDVETPEEYIKILGE